MVREIDWAGRTVVAMASGPSMSAAIAQRVRDSGAGSIVVNNTFALAPWADWLHAADGAWWQQHADAHKFAGVQTCADANVQPGGRVRRIQISGRTGFDPDPGKMRSGAHSGYQALHIALQRGAARVLLCGYDLRERDGARHWHDDHRHPLRNTHAHQLSLWARIYETLAAQMPASAQVINCTPDSAITAFPFMPLDEALAAMQQETRA